MTGSGVKGYVEGREMQTGRLVRSLLSFKSDDRSLSQAMGKGQREGEGTVGRT